MSGYIGNIPTPQATQTRETFTATASQTTFNTAGYTPGFVDVWLNGVKLVNGDDFTATNGSDVVLTVGAASGDTVEVLSFSTFEVNSQTFTGDTSAVNLNVTGTFTSRGIDDNATSTAMTLDASGNLLVGKTISDGGATEGTEVKSNGFVNLTKSNDNALNVNRLSSDGAIAVFRKDGTTVGAIGVVAGNNLVVHSSQSGHFGLEFGSVGIAPTNNSGNPVDNTVDMGSATYRFKDLYLSGGVYLGGTGAANKLDDYEEGTWTPVINQGASSVTYSVQIGSYTKIGQLVVLNFQLSFTAWTGTSDNCEIGGWPFVVFNANDNRGQGSLLIDNLTSSQNHPLLQANIGQSEGVLLANVGGTGSHTGLAGNNLTASTVIRGSVFYRTSQ